MTAAEHVHGLPVFRVLCVLAIAVFTFSVWRRIRTLRSVRWLPRTDRPLERLKGALSGVFGQKKLFYDPVPGLAHALIFWGFCVISIESMQFFLSAFSPDMRLPLTLGPFYGMYEIFLVLVLLSVTYAAGRRLFFSTRVVRSMDGLFVLFMILGLVVSGLILSSQETAFAGQVNTWKVATNIFHVRPSPGLYNAVWWLHGLIFLGFLNYLPYSKHMHVLTVVFNVYFRDLEHAGRIRKLDLENAERFGLADVRDLNFKDVLDGYTCTECGRCTEVCPANRVEKHLDPRRIILDIRDYVRDHERNLPKDGSEPKKIVEAYIKKQDIFDCTTCHACVSLCPVENEHLSKILGIRQALVLMEGDMPDEYERTFRNLENNNNPWGMPGDERGERERSLELPTLAEKPDAEYVLFLGCAGRYDERAMKVAGHFARILQKAEIDVAVLGDEAFCCGDPARRMGNEYLFQMMVEAGREVIDRCGLTEKKIVTADPHCFNTLRNEYPDFGLPLNVEHHSSFLSRLLSENHIRAKANGGRKLVFHDSCYLARYNNLQEEPRRTLSKLGHNVVEMKSSRRESMCCGAGGGRAFLEEDKVHRVNVARVREALDAGGEEVVVACPYCALMFEDGLKELQCDRKVYDLAEVIAESLL